MGRVEFVMVTGLLLLGGGSLAVGQEPAPAETVRFHGRVSPFYPWKPTLAVSISPIHSGLGPERETPRLPLLCASLSSIRFHLKPLHLLTEEGGSEVAVGAPLRFRQEATRRFGSRAYARRLLDTRGHLAESGPRKRLVQRSEARVEASAEAGGRRRLLPFEVFLARAGGSERLFAAGPYDELRCVERAVASDHRVEFLTWLEPHDTGSEGYRAFGSLHLSRGDALPDLRRSPILARLCRERGLKAIPRARVRGRGLEGVVTLEPATGSGSYRREGQPDLDRDGLLALVRALDPVERISWLEGAFRTSPKSGVAVHRYYLDAEARCWLVRHTAPGKQLVAMTPSRERVPGLWIYPVTHLAAAA